MNNVDFNYFLHDQYQFEFQPKKNRKLTMPDFRFHLA